MRAQREINPLGVALTVALALVVLLPNIGANLAEDDEGAYLYTSWRLASGEALFEEIPSSKPPLPFYIGAFLVRLFGPEVLPLRLASALALALAAGVLYAGARRFSTIPHAWIVPVVFVLHPDAYMQGRFFRPDAFMLFFVTLGLVLALLAEKDLRRPTMLAGLAGLAFGLALICKFNAMIPLALAATVLASSRRWKALAWMTGTALAIGILVLVAFELAGASSLYELTLGHHLRQDSPVHPGVKIKAFLRENAPILLVCFASVLRTPGRVTGEARALRVLALATAASFLVFFFVGREVYLRHFVYAAPCFALLAPPAVEAAGARVGSMLPGAWARLSAAKTIVILALLAALGMTWEWSATRAWRGENAGFRSLAEGLDAALEPGAPIFSDYAMLNFLARRPGIPATSILSQGAVLSGQVTTEGLVEELDQRFVQAVVIHTEGSFAFRYGVKDKILTPGHLASLPDLTLFRSELAQRMRLETRVACQELVFEIWTRDPPAREFEWTPPCRTIPAKSASGDSAWVDR